MRALIKVKNPEREQVPFNYQYGLASMLYKRLATADVELANKAHKPNEFRHFNFSQLQLQPPFSTNGGLTFEDAHLHLTSPDKKFIQTYCEGLLKEPEFYLGDADLFIETIEILPEKEISEKETLRTLSPIYVKTGRKNSETGKVEEWDLYPDDGKWYENIHHNLVKRFEDYHGQPPEEDHFHITNVRGIKGKRIRIRNSWRRCTHLEMKLEASKELMRFALSAGLGEKTGMGFGCMEVI